MQAVLAGLQPAAEPASQFRAWQKQQLGGRLAVGSYQQQNDCSCPREEGARESSLPALLVVVKVGAGERKRAGKHACKGSTRAPQRTPPNPAQRARSLCQVRWRAGKHACTPTPPSGHAHIPSHVDAQNSVAACRAHSLDSAPVGGDARVPKGGADRCGAGHSSGAETNDLLHSMRGAHSRRDGKNGWGVSLRSAVGWGAVWWGGAAAQA